MIAIARPGNNAWFVMTATGKELKNFRYTAEGLAEFKKLPDEQRTPKEVKRITVNPPGLPGPIVDTRWPPPPPETLGLGVYTRALDRLPKGQLIRAERDSKGRKPFAWGTGPARDWLWLTETEWKSLVPSEPVRGMKFPVPRPIAYRIFRFYLDDSCEGGHWFWEPDHVRADELIVTVDEVSADALRFRLAGAATMGAGDSPKDARRCRAQFLGFMNFDRGKKVFSRFDMVAVVSNYQVPDIFRPDLSHPQTLGIAVNLAAKDALGYGAPPYALYRKCEAGYNNARQTDGYLPIDHAQLKPYFEADKGR